ncbi:putative short-subunit dehydrogenase-like oxidoreductase (DUF2520 family) [Bradyrhizobium sp. USDA 4501]|uniref:Rossmann-like and DUF2520 domain-containing protein n=1 Tax=Bradyrhizobium brasilense TaxID=1419277 RepID=UPI0014577D9B|nr:DUF2520 domain-containing protein [Bradyrhizobium brasilense]NLS69794.1 DUF2520 domain-containing protein [Bradyrhizobium brasilense]
MSTALAALRIGFIGAGRVAQTLAPAFACAGLNVAAFYNRGADAAQRLGSRIPSARPMTDAQQVVDRCDMVFLTVSDDAILPVCRDLRWEPRHRVVHCSGATELAALDHAKSAGAATGGFHPMQMFANPDVALEGLRGCTVGIEAEGDFRRDLELLATRIGCEPLALPAGARALYHASAYYVGPFLIALLKEGVELWKSFGASETDALRAMMPLLRGTVAAVLDGGLANGMGGCVARGDVGTILKHLRALDERFPPSGALYRELALRNVPLGIERGTLSAPRAAEIERLLLRTRSEEHAAS